MDCYPRRRGFNSLRMWGPVPPQLGGEFTHRTGDAEFWAEVESEFHFEDHFMQATFDKPHLEHLRTSQFNASAVNSARQLILSPGVRPASDALFISLLDGFRPTGGLARAEEILMQSRFSSGLPVAQLGRLIAERRVLSVHWNHLYWLPLFQFIGQGIEPPPAVASVLMELICVMDEWRLAEWFCWPHQKLEGSTPAAHISIRPSAVLEAASADRIAIVSSSCPSGSSPGTTKLGAFGVTSPSTSLLPTSRAE